jgi:prepilin-type N-terminal cleavage/methylation domain-containing protein
MKIRFQNISRRHAAFTLMELLVVISIIAILAALIFPVGAALKNKAALKKARTQLKEVEALIARYKTRFGYYPPDHPTAVGVNPYYNSLYFELVGSTRSGAVGNYTYTSLDGAVTISEADCQSDLGVGGILNCTKSSGEESKPAEKLLVQLKPNQYYQYTRNTSTIRLLVCSVLLPENGPEIITGTRVNPWAYIKNGTNNPGGFDLWVDVIVGGKTNRIGNWN